MNKPLIISVADGGPSYGRQSLVTLKSFHENVRPFGAEMVWLTSNMPEAGIKRCNKFGVEVVKVNGDFGDYGNRQRHWHMLQWLCQNRDRGYTHVLTIDARDVVFLADPFSYKPIYEPGVIVSAEASTYANCPWNARDAKRMMDSLRPNCQVYDGAWPIVNGGHLAGSFREVIWAEMARFAIDCRTGSPTDQATLGFLTNWTKDWNTLFRVVKVSEPWICHGHFWRNFEHSIKVTDGYKVRNAGGELYRLFHQWDRQTVPESVRKAILDKFGTE